MTYNCTKPFKSYSGKNYAYGDKISSIEYGLLLYSEQSNFTTSYDTFDSDSSNSSYNIGNLSSFNLTDLFNSPGKDSSIGNDSNIDYNSFGGGQSGGGGASGDW